MSASAASRDLTVAVVAAVAIVVAAVFPGTHAWSARRTAWSASAPAWTADRRVAQPPIFLERPDGAAILAVGTPGPAERAPGTASRVLLQDDFSDPDTGWPVTDTPDVNTAYVGGEYHVLLKHLPGSVVVTNGPDVADFDLQVTARAPDSTLDRAYGLVFGITTEGGRRSYRQLLVDPWDGKYVVRSTDGATTADLFAWTRSTAIRLGGDSNVLRVERRGSQLQIIVNDVLLRTVTDPAPVRGQTGLSAYNYGDPSGAGFAFDDFLLAEPEPAPSVTPAASTTPLSPGTVLLRDDFSDPLSGWPDAQNSSCVFGYADGAYRVATKGQSGCIVPHGPVVGDAGAQVDVRSESAADAPLYGLVIGYSDGAPGRRYHMLLASPSDGTFAVVERLADGRALLRHRWTASGAVARGGATNRLRIERRAREIRVFVNGTLLATLLSDSIADGRVGLYVAPDGSAPGQAGIFDDFLLETIGSPAAPTIASPATLPTATGTPIGGGTPTPDLPHTPTAEGVLFFDDFSDASGGWDQWHYAGDLVEVRAGEYHMSMDGARAFWTIRSRNGPEVGDFAAEVRARSAAFAGQHFYGITFGGDDAGAGYAFVVTPWSGEAALVTSDWREVASFRPSPDVRLGERTNVLRVERRGRDVDLLVNGSRVGRLELDDVAPGRTGLVAAAFRSPGGVDFFFDDFLLERPDPDGMPTEAVPHPSATPPAPPPDAWTPVLHDRFGDRTSGWPVDDNATYALDYWGDAYHVLAKRPHTLVQAALRPMDGVFAAQVEARTEGTDRATSVGLIADAVHGGDFFAFLVRPLDGSYAVVRYEAGQGQPLYDWTPSPNIRTGTAANILRLERGPWGVTLAVNGSLLATVPSWSRESGYVGVAAMSGGDLSGGLATFDDFVLERAAHDGTRTPALPLRSPVPVLLPLVRRGPPVATPTPDPGNGTVTVSFGIGTDGQGRLIGEGREFQFGAPSLVSRIAYQGLDPGSRLSWTWVVDGRAPTAAGLHGTIVVEASDGHHDSLIAAEDAGALPVGTYEMRVHGGGALRATGAAIVRREPPAGATPIPPSSTPGVALPTAVTPSPSATNATTPPAPVCHQILANPGFEEGPVAWGYASTAIEPWAEDIGHVVRRAADLAPPRKAPGGRWLAHIRHGPNTQHLLYQAALLPEPLGSSSMVSASLSFDAAVVTEAIPNGIEEHALAAFFMNVEDVSRYRVVQGSIVSEERNASGTWYRMGPYSVASVLAPRPGWPASFLAMGVASAPDATETDFLIDNVVLTVCWRGAPAAMSLDRRGEPPLPAAWPDLRLRPNPAGPTSRRASPGVVQGDQP